MRRLLPFALLLILIAAASTACLTTPGDTSQITFVSTSTVNGWKYDYYRNAAYPCSISGDQTFVIGTKVGSSPTATAPLWMWLHGGGVGYFDTTGTPQPDTQQMTEQTANGLLGGLNNPGLGAKIRADAAGFRTLAVSYCDRDLYSGAGEVDPNNPHTNADGSARTTNGLLATKAALAFTEALYPTSKYLIGGGSAGSAGAYNVAWAMQESGNAPAGVVGDASVVNVEQGAAAYAQGVCASPKFSPDALAILQKRLEPDLGNVNNETDKLVSSGRLTVPLLHIWNHGDTNTCGSTPMACPLRNGTTTTLGATDCDHQPLAAAITAEGVGSKSKNLPLCVDSDTTPDCSLHVVSTHAGLVNTDPASPADYVTAIITWVDARLADS